MKSRICLSEELLSEYLAGCLTETVKEHVEKHLCVCSDCRRLVVETYETVSQDRVRQKWKVMARRVKSIGWLIGACIFFVLSFLFPKYFAQFLVACFIMGAKWIVDSKATRLLITIHEAWKRGDKSESDKESSHFDRR